MKYVALLGSTGSIGSSALDVIRQHPHDFRIVALAARRNVRRLLKQIRELEPELVCVYEDEAARKLERALGRRRRPKVVSGDNGLEEVAKLPRADFVLCGVVGAKGIAPILAAVRAGKDVGIANKEPLVMAGDLIMEMAQRRKAKILPIDSEHSAIWQCLQCSNGQQDHEVKRLILTASGGPFLGRRRSELKNITPAEAVRHPRWKMGKKISVDSATLMNKGFEVKEAHHLFNVPVNKIKILVPSKRSNVLK